MEMHSKDTFHPFSLSSLKIELSIITYQRNQFDGPCNHRAFYFVIWRNLAITTRIIKQSKSKVGEFFMFAELFWLQQ